ncbi:FGGY-family carbohydrate kinase, partial [Acinetobacter baumannii]|nr:FGGY-family carbohydrate kinase [Acinetobacter baumannii]
HWASDAEAAVFGMTRTTGRAEFVRAADESIAYQIFDVADAMRRDSGLALSELRVDGGPTRDGYLMQFLTDLLE